MRAALLWLSLATGIAAAVGLPQIDGQVKNEPIPKQQDVKPPQVAKQQPPKKAIKRIASPQVPNEETTPSAPSDFGGSNGFTTPQQFVDDQNEFEDEQTVDTGLGPVFNNDSCRQCHHHPVTGGSAGIRELRAGKNVGGVFVNHANQPFNLKLTDGTFVPSTGGSLIHSRSTDPAIQERALAEFDLRGFRSANPLFGLGFVECISLTSLQAVQAAQPVEMRGELILVPLLEAKPPLTRAGRFGWKNQHASLMSFSADAYINEIGITSPLQPIESLSNGRPTAGFPGFQEIPTSDTGGDQGFGNDVEQFARFMRALKVPPRDVKLAVTPQAQQGLAIFRQIGCAICHTEKFTTLPAGTGINGNPPTFIIPDALGNKDIFPFSDFLLHDIGTGDGIVINGPQTTANKFRTVPLWGLRLKRDMMHDNQTNTRNDAILRHSGEAKQVTLRYIALSLTDKELLILFLRSL